MFSSPTRRRDNHIGDKQSQMTAAVTEIHETFPITRVFEHRFARIICAGLRVPSHNKADTMILCSGLKNEIHISPKRLSHGVSAVKSTLLFLRS